MTSMIDMSLEDIIRKKKTTKRGQNDRLQTGQPTSKIRGRNPPPPLKQVPISDARNKIISKKRTQIVDARDKLAQMAKQKDARLKLEAMRKKRALMQAQIKGGRNFIQTRGKLVRNAPSRNAILRNAPRNEIVFGDPSRQVVSQPITQASSHIKRGVISLQTSNNLRVKPQLTTKKFLTSRSIGRGDRLERSVGRSTSHDTPKPILRTVENDLDIQDDPMGEEEYEAPRPSMLNRRANLQLRIIAHNDTRDNHSYSHLRMSSPEKEKSPPRPISILKKRPMAALRTEKKPEKLEKPLEYRIIVSNLRNTVTGGDIEELFGDVGGMVESRLVRPGTAEVLYRTVEDAQRAVDLYHNRQLDGQPMNCLLVTPRAPAAPAAAVAAPAVSTRNGSKPVLYSTNSNVEPDISTFHKVLFSNF